MTVNLWKIIPSILCYFNWNASDSENFVFQCWLLPIRCLYIFFKFRNDIFLHIYNKILIYLHNSTVFLKNLGSQLLGKFLLKILDGKRTNNRKQKNCAPWGGPWFLMRGCGCSHGVKVEETPTSWELEDFIHLHFHVWKSFLKARPQNLRRTSVGCLFLKPVDPL